MSDAIVLKIGKEIKGAVEDIKGRAVLSENYLHFAKEGGRFNKLKKSFRILRVFVDIS